MHKFMKGQCHKHTYCESWNEEQRVNRRFFAEKCLKKNDKHTKQHWDYTKRHRFSNKAICTA